MKKLREDGDLFNSIKNDALFITPMRNPTRFQDYMNQANAMSTHDTRDYLKNVKTPTLIIGAQKDRLIPPVHQEFLHEKIEGSKLVIMKGCGHGFTMEEPNKVNELLKSFIEAPFKILKGEIDPSLEK